MFKYITCVALIIIVGLLIIYFATPGPENNTDIKAEKDIELMDRLTTALQSIMDDIDSSLAWNRRAKQEPPIWWWELKEE